MSVTIHYKLNQEEDEKEISVNDSFNVSQLKEEIAKQGNLNGEISLQDQDQNQIDDSTSVNDIKDKQLLVSVKEAEKQEEAPEQQNQETTQNEQQNQETTQNEKESTVQKEEQQPKEEQPKEEQPKEEKPKEEKPEEEQSDEEQSDEEQSEEEQPIKQNKVKDVVQPSVSLLFLVPFVASTVACFMNHILA